MPFFFVDDAFDTSKEVMSIPARSRNAAVGLWVRCGAWSAANLTDGAIPADIIQAYAGRAAKTLTDHLVVATLWDHGPDGSAQFRNWEKWQRTAAQVRAYRGKQAEKKRRQRDEGATKVQPKCNESALKVSPKCKGGNDEHAPEVHDETAPTSTDVELSPGDTTGDTNSCPPGIPHTPIPVPIPKYLTGSLSSSGQVGIAPAAPPPDRAMEPVSATLGGDLVAEAIPTSYPSPERTVLRLKANEMLHTGTSPDDIRGGLRIWLSKPHLGAGALPACVSEHIKLGQRSNGVSKTTAKALGYRQLGQELINELHGERE